MALFCHKVTFPRLGRDDLDAWRGLPAAVVADAMNRAGAMDAQIKPVRLGMRLLGQARTAAVMVGDNSALHAVLPRMRAGEVLVVDAASSTSHAVWGGILTHIALRQQIAGVVIDGAVRDIQELRGRDLPVYCRAATPRGPHKGFGGTLDAVIAAGGVTVSPGDLVIGDDDGVVVVPLRRIGAVLRATRELMSKERQVIDRIDAGQPSSELFAVPDPTPLESCPAPPRRGVRRR